MRLDITPAGTSIATPVSIANGGTGQTAKVAAFNALSPLISAGDIIIMGAAGDNERLGIPVIKNKVLRIDTASSVPNWDYVDLVDDITNTLAVGTGGTGATTAAGARTNLGLGSIATQAASSVTITGGSITGITDLAIADGGTNSSAALNNQRVMTSVGGAIVESGAITDGEGIQRNDTTFISAPLPLGTVEGRLTLTTAVPITIADVTAATTIYFAPYKGDRIYLYDGTRWKLYSFTERSLALGTLTNALPYDVFIYDNAGTLTLEFLAWTNGTTRATALVTQNGVLCKTGALTRRYLGTFYTTATTTTEDSEAKRFLWNYYNRVTKKLKVIESANNWTYNTAAWRQMNNSTANQVAIVTGWAEDIMEIIANAYKQYTVGTFGYGGIGEDVTNANTGDIKQQIHSAAANVNGMCWVIKVPAVGYHYYAALEYGHALGGLWYGDAGVPTELQCGIYGKILC